MLCSLWLLMEQEQVHSLTCVTYGDGSSPASGEQALL